MLLKLALTWVVSLVAIVGYEILYHRSLSTRELSEPVRFIFQTVLILGGIFYYTSSAFWGAFAVLYLLPPDTIIQGRIEATIGLLIGIWVLGIFLQLALNAARMLAGSHARPLVFFNMRIFAVLSRGKRNSEER